MGIREWAKKFPWKKKHPDRTSPASSVAPVQDAPITVSNPVSCSPTQSTSPPPTNQGALGPVRDPVLAPPPAPTTTTTNQKAPGRVLGPGLSSPPPQKTTSTNNLSVTVGNGLIVALKLLKEAVTGIDVPGLEATVSGVVAVIDLIKDVKDNIDDLGALNGLISNLANTISMAPNLHRAIEMDGLLRSRIDVFLSGLHEMMKQVQKMLGEGIVSRTANIQAHIEAIQDIKSGLTFLLNQFTVQGTLSLELNMAGARQDIWMLAQAQEALALAAKYEDLIEAIPRAGARYNDTSTKPSRPCHPGTRTGLLEIIIKWIEDPKATPYFWLCGEVGVGKTTVAHTIAQEQEALKRLGACFFFSRHDDSRRNPYLLFTSIAYQLARFDQGFYNALAKALKPNPDIVKRTPMEQFRKLVLEPLSQSGIDPSRTVVVVIDGLDECSDAPLVLDVLTQGIDDVGVQLRILISSRPYAAILSKFEDTRLCHLTSDTKFRDIDPDILSKDVEAYLSWSLGDLASRRRLPSPWPPKAQLDELIERAAGLIIIASTYTKYIDDPEAGNPTGQLARIISRKRGMGSSPLAELDALYDQILDDMKSKLVSASQVLNARDIIAFVILAPNNINVSILSGLFHVDPFDVRLVLRRLTAVILLPEDDYGNIAPFHASFGEYLQDSTRCTVQQLSVEGEVAYGRMAVRCSDAIASAAKDGIIGVEYDSARGFSWIPVHLDYSLEHLASYLCRSPPARVEEVQQTIIETGIWAVLRIVFAKPFGDDTVQEIDEAGGFKDLSHLVGPYKTDNSGGAPLAPLMVAHHASEINRVLQEASISVETIRAEASQHNRQIFLKFAEITRGYTYIASGYLAIVRNVRCWTKYSHSNIMSFKGIDVKFNDKNEPQEVLVHVKSPVNIQRSSSLYAHLKSSNNLDMASRLRMALGIADGLRYLHGSSPPQPHNCIGPRQIMVSEGLPLLYPSRWEISFQSTLPYNEKDDSDELTCHHDYDFSPSGWYHWNPTGGIEWQRSLEARLQVDVWDFGSILYQMLTGEEPLTTYNRLAEGNDDLDYKPPNGHDFDSDNDAWDISRYETAVPLLLNTLDTSEEIKKLLKSCWTIRPQARPPMSEVFERLKAIVEAMEQ